MKSKGGILSIVNSKVDHILNTQYFHSLYWNYQYYSKINYYTPKKQWRKTKFPLLFKHLSFNFSTKFKEEKKSLLRIHWFRPQILVWNLLLIWCSIFLSVLIIKYSDKSNLLREVKEGSQGRKLVKGVQRKEWSLRAPQACV